MQSFKKAIEEPVQNPKPSFVRGRRYTTAATNNDEASAERSENNNVRGQSSEQDDYFEPQNATSMISTIAKAQSKIQAQFQGNRAMHHFNRQNLSKSIILHHNKMSSLLSTVGRYNEGISRPDIMEEDYEARQAEDIDNIIVEDEGHMIGMPGKLANGAIV